MSTHGYVCDHRECNVIVSFCVLSLPLCLLTFNLFRLAAHCCFLFVFLPPFLPLFPTLCPLSLSCSSSLLLICTSTRSSSLFLRLSFLSSSSPPISLLPPPADCGKQETSGLSSASGCGRHGEDARAGLEVCVYVPAGVLQGSGDEGPG